ncbi:1-phosphofructokinase [Corynebacterium sp. NML140438]|uniref:1-phosphofructokinase family hexose kinase n=1 Tax=Corynebacterium sp. NML140438 TaxID=1906334 RepID=UPI0008FB93A1|nr:1-phosphofructokinase family hexose kinase [Corynebacterium sp. NML140438]OIR42467.1 1-phosphofructokinase [Corynebacterium sp. NML140438]
MILTFTPNPSTDATLSVETLRRGEVARAISATREAGGKGVNVAHAVAKAGQPTLAVVPCGDNDPFKLAADRLGLPIVTIPVEGTIRTNTAITESDGTTTKVNEPGPEYTPDIQREFLETIDAHSSQCKAVVMAGSLPSGAPTDLYATLTRELRSRLDEHVLVAVDTSDEPLVKLGQQLESAAPDVLKPNAFELAQLVGADGNALESSAANGNYTEIIEAAKTLIRRGAKEILVTLGGAGACLVTADSAWAATPPPTDVKSTVGAGDSSLAGYIMARTQGLAFDQCLRTAVAYGSAAAGLPGTGIPSPDDINLAQTRVVAIDS